MTNEVDKQPVYDPDYERERQEKEEEKDVFEVDKDVEDTTKDTLDKIAKLHRLFCSLYSHVVYGVDLRYIQLNPVFFKRVLKGEKISANWNGDKIMIKGMVEDVTVVTLL